MRNAWATLIVNAAHIPVDIYHIAKGRNLFLVSMGIGLLFITLSVVYIRRSKGAHDVETTNQNNNTQRNLICAPLRTYALRPAESCTLRSIEGQRVSERQIKDVTGSRNLLISNR